MTDTKLDRDGVKERFGVWPEQIIDYLALMGDASDNIPGVPKVGPKTAAKWLESYGDLEGVIANATAIKGKVGESLRDSLEQLSISRTLATIKCDVALDIHLDGLHSVPTDIEVLRELFTQFEFKSWLAELGEESATGEAAPAMGDYRIVNTAEDLDALVEEICKAQSFAIEIVTATPDYMTGGIVGIAVATRRGAGAYIPVGHEEPEQLDRELVVKRLAPLLEDSHILKTGHDLKFQRNVFVVVLNYKEEKLYELDISLDSEEVTRCEHVLSLIHI